MIRRSPSSSRARIAVWLGAFLPILFTVAASAESSATVHERATATLEAAFESYGVTGALVLYDEATATWFRYGSDEALGRHMPASTFKVPNAIIALEVGAVPDEHTVLPWDGVSRTIRSWNRNHDLSSAMEFSVLWYYQEMARRAGVEHMQSWIDRFGYGSREITGPIDLFWIDGSLTIAPEEQVAFLRRLRAGTLPASAEHQETVRRIMRRDWRGCMVNAKTGWGIDGNVHHGWYVGWIDRQDGAHVFALYVREEGAREDVSMWTNRPAILDRTLRTFGSSEGCSPAEEGLASFGPLPE